MSALPEPSHAAPKTHSLTRRRVLTGAAWSVPVIAAAVAVPTASASGHTRQTYTVSVTGNGAQMATTTFTLPADATNIVYSVEGGNGAGHGSVRGGRGARLTGAISDSGTALSVTLTAAGGGLKGTNGNTSRRGDGGAGFGVGGSTPASPSGAIPPGTFSQVNGGGGGGGSALHIGGDLAVVAGGGGGAGAANGQNNNSPYETLMVSGEPHGGNAGPASAAAPTASTYFTDGQARTLTATGGGTGTASDGGTGGAGTTSGYYAPTERTAPGANGGSAAAPADERGKGADALAWMLSNRMSSTVVYVFAGTSGGGGGGYTGGGSGGTALGSWEYSHLVGLGSGGGGGSNFTASTAGGLAVSPAAPAVRLPSGMPGDGEPGTVTITFDADAGLTFP